MCRRKPSSWRCGTRTSCYAELLALLAQQTNGDVDRCSEQSRYHRSTGGHVIQRHRALVERNGPGRQLGANPLEFAQRLRGRSIPASIRARSSSSGSTRARRSAPVWAWISDHNACSPIPSRLTSSRAGSIHETAATTTSNCLDCWQRARTLRRRTGCWQRVASDLWTNNGLSRCAHERSAM